MFNKISSDNLRSSIIRIMKEEHLDPLSPSLIHSQLEKDLGVDLADHNQEVMNMINETLNAENNSISNKDCNNNKSNVEESKTIDNVGGGMSENSESREAVNVFVQEWLSHDFWVIKDELQRLENNSQVVTLIADLLKDVITFSSRKRSRGRNTRQSNAPKTNNDNEDKTDGMPSRRSSRSTTDLTKDKSLTMNKPGKVGKPKANLKQQVNTVPSNKSLKDKKKCTTDKPKMSSTNKNAKVPKYEKKNSSGAKRFLEVVKEVQVTRRQKAKQLKEKDVSKNKDKSTDDEADQDKAGRRAQRSAGAKTREFYSSTLQNVIELSSKQQSLKDLKSKPNENDNTTLDESKNRGRNRSTRSETSKRKIDSSDSESLPPKKQKIESSKSGKSVKNSNHEKALKTVDNSSKSRDKASAIKKSLEESKAKLNASNRRISSKKNEKGSETIEYIVPDSPPPKKGRLQLREGSTSEPESPVKKIRAIKVGKKGYTAKAEYSSKLATPVKTQKSNLSSKKEVKANKKIGSKNKPVYLNSDSDESVQSNTPVKKSQSNPKTTISKNTKTNRARTRSSESTKMEDTASNSRKTPKRGAAVLAGVKSVSMKAEEEEENEMPVGTDKVPFTPSLNTKSRSKKNDNDDGPLDFLKLTEIFSKRLEQSPFESKKRAPTEEKEEEFKCPKCPAFYLDLKGLNGHVDRFHKDVTKADLRKSVTTPTKNPQKKTKQSSKISPIKSSTPSSAKILLKSPPKNTKNKTGKNLGPKSKRVATVTPEVKNIPDMKMTDKKLDNSKVDNSKIKKVVNDKKTKVTAAKNELSINTKEGKAEASNSSRPSVINKKKQSKKEDIETNSATQSNKKNDNKSDKNTLQNKSDKGTNKKNQASETPNLSEKSSTNIKASKKPTLQPKKVTSKAKITTSDDESNPKSIAKSTRNVSKNSNNKRKRESSDSQSSSDGAESADSGEDWNKSDKSKASAKLWAKLKGIKEKRKR